VPCHLAIYQGDRKKGGMKDVLNNISSQIAAGDSFLFATFFPVTLLSFQKLLF